MRDNIWLTERLIHLWKTYFPDIEHGNEIKIRFGRKSKTRLGSIAIRKKECEHRRLLRNEYEALSSDEAISIITINAHLAHHEVPEQIIDAVIAHEFCHFAHGFNSMREQLFKTPHANGVVHKELHARGLEDIHRFQKRWVKEHWVRFIAASR